MEFARKFSPNRLNCDFTLTSITLSDRSDVTRVLSVSELKAIYRNISDPWVISTRSTSMPLLVRHLQTIQDHSNAETV